MHPGPHAVGQRLCCYDLPRCRSRIKAPVVFWLTLGVSLAANCPSLLNGNCYTVWPSHDLLTLPYLNNNNKPHRCQGTHLLTVWLPLLEATICVPSWEEGDPSGSCCAKLFIICVYLWVKFFVFLFCTPGIVWKHCTRLWEKDAFFPLQTKSFKSTILGCTGKYCLALRFSHC